MAKPKVALTLEGLFELINDRLRRLELRLNRVGNWSLAEDGGNGQLIAVRDNGTGVPKTMRRLANPAGPEIRNFNIINIINVAATMGYEISVDDGTGNLIATNLVTGTVTALAFP